MNKKPKLIPPDPKQCQANHLEGAWPDAQHFMIIGPRKLVRCKEKPVAIITERKPSEKDGECGSMSLCPNCLKKARESFPKGHFTEETIV